MDEHELNALFEKLRLGIALTDEEMVKLSAALGGATNATKQFKKALTSAIGDLTKSMASFTTGTDAGAGNFKALNPVIDGAAKATKTMANAAGDVASAFGPVGAIVGGAMKAIGAMSGVVADASKYMVGEMQKSAEAFNNFGQVGALTVKGMTGMQEQFVRSGMQLESFQKVIVSNADTMARFRGQVGRGATDFSKVVGDIVDSNVGKELRRIGYSADQLGEGTAAYVKMQTQLGLSQKKTNAELTAGSIEYLKQQDLLAKATGMSRKAIEDQQQAALSEGRFRATTDEMVANGQEKQAKTLLDFQTMVAKAAPEMAAGLRDAASGFTSSSASQKLFMDTGGAATEILEKVKNGSIDQVEAFKQLQGATRGQLTMTRDITKALGDEGGTFSKYADRSNLATAEVVDGLVKLKNEQKKQMTEGTDPLTDSTVAAQEAMQKMFRQMQQFGFEIMPQAATAVEAFTRSTNRFIKTVAKATGAELPGQKERDAAEKATQEANVDKVITPFERVIRGATKGFEAVVGMTPIIGDFLETAMEDARVDNEQAEALKRLSKLPKFADGGVTGGLSFAGESGPEAVIPLKGGSVPVKLSGLDANLAGGKAAAAGSKLTTSSPGQNLATVIPPLTKAIIPFTEALNNFTAMTQTTSMKDVREGEEARKGESMFDKMVSFIANLFGGEGISGGKAGGTSGKDAASAALKEHDHSHEHEAPKISPDVAKQLGKELGSPLENLKVTSGFGMRVDPITGKQAGHGGVDLAGKIGDAIRAPEGGTARVTSEKNSGGYGNMVEILNDQGKVIHKMAHMSETMIKTGDKIEAGMDIGKVGNTGRSTGAHLHWEQFDPTTGKQIDPIAALAAKSGKTPGFETTPNGAAYGNPQATQRGQNIGAPQFPNTPGQIAGGTIGKMSEKYETGGRGSETVGWDKVGGTSYGKYQIASKVGAMDDYLKFLEKKNPEAAAQLRASGPAETGSAGGAFADKWKELSKSGALGDTEHEFIKQKSYDPAMAGLKDPKLKAMIEGNKGLQEMMWSTSVQHGGGGAAGIMNKVFKEGMSEEDLVKAAYAERGTKFGSSTEAVQKSVQARFGKEQADVMGMLGQPGMPGTPESITRPVTVPGGPGMPGTPAIPGYTPPAAGPTMTATAPSQSPVQSLLSSILGPELGGAIGGLASGLMGSSGAAPGIAGVAGPVLPTAPVVGGGSTELIAAIKEQGQATTSAITTSMENLTAQLSGGSGGADGGSQVPELLTELIGAQRDQTAAINRLIQVQTS